MQIPLDEKVNELSDVPYTISYVIRKLVQVDQLNELPKEKRPPEKIIWDGRSNEIDDWLDRVLFKKESPNIDFSIDDNEIG